MASAIDICNLALAHIGEDPKVASISPPDGSAASKHCARFYPMARDALLESHCWRFATRRADLAALSVTPPGTWVYAYAAPGDMLRPWALLPPGVDEDTGGAEYLVETLSSGALVIYADVELAQLQYTVVVTDTAKFPPLFVDALSWKLASYLAGPITRNVKIQAAAAQMADKLIGAAQAADANGRRRDTYGDFVASSVQARA